MNYRYMFPALLAFFLLTSCFGINADITLNRNGSGTINLEYQISKSLETLGRLDGNERWNTIPVGRADFERTLERLPEMKLLSFSSREDENNLVVAVKMEFSSIQGLFAFLDAHGQRFSFTGDPSSGRMVLTLNEGGETINPGLDNLINAVSGGYFVNIGMTFPGEGNAVVTDRQGTPVNSGDVLGQGRRVSARFPLYDVLSADNGLNVEFSW